MKRLICLAILFLFLLNPQISSAQTTQTPPTSLPSQTYIKARVIKIEKEGRNPSIKNTIFQEIRAQILEGSEKGKEVLIRYGDYVKIRPEQKLKAGDIIVLATSIVNGKTDYLVWDKYRLNTALFLILGFFLLVFITAGKKGLGAILGMVISLLIIAQGIVPQILAGHDPLLVSILGSIVILLLTIYLAHGISQKTTVALTATVISLAITGILSILFVDLLKLSGLGTEEAALLQLQNQVMNLRGLLLGGIIIGVLGVLDDITTAQAQAVYTLAKANTKWQFKELFLHGYEIGKEHIASLVNTLVLAYAGASIGVFIFIILTLQLQTTPLWVILNSEIILEEVVRTLAGSIGLLLAVPITTALASFFAKYSISVK